MKLRVIHRREVKALIERSYNRARRILTYYGYSARDERRADEI